MGASAPRIWGTLDPFLEFGPVWGRKVANAQFLKALLALDPLDAYHFFLNTPKQVRDFRAEARKHWPALTAEGRIQVFLRHDLPQAVANTEYHCFHLSDCINHPPALARLRNACSRSIFPVTSVTHSLSYPDYPARFLDHLWPGVTSRDCIVATSRAGKTAVQAYFDILRERFGLDPALFPQPRIEIIPLGLNDPFPPEKMDRLRAEGRTLLQAGSEQCVMLVLGRISPHAKMDLLPLLRAWQRVTPKRRPALLAIAGWVEPKDDFPATFRTLAGNVGLPCCIIPCPDEERKRQLYAAADLFISLADNPQETFGLTLLEAALAGLPVIASDYSGYRDLVLHGRTGLLVPTWGPRDSRNIDLLSGLIPDYEVQFFLAQQTVVQVPALAEALAGLYAQPELGRSMGAQGRRHALERYSWPAVLKNYLSLWDGLCKQEPGPARTMPRPAELSYAQTFASFPAATLDDENEVQTTRAGVKILQKNDFPVIYAGLEYFVSPELLRPLLVFARRPLCIAALKQKLETLAQPHRPGQISFCVLWAVKHDLLAIRTEQDAACGLATAR